jgi:hypothetical protein
MGQVGHSATEGTHRPGKASRPQALSAGSRRQEADRLRAAMAALVPQAPPPDAADDAAWGRRRGEALPAAWARRADRLATIEAARRRLEARAPAAAAAARPRRAEADAARPRLGRARRGQAPTPVDETPDDTAQTHCTAPAWQRRRTTDPGGASCGQAHARGEAADQLIVAWDVTPAAHDTPHAEPLARLTGAHREQAGMARPTDATGAAQTLPATSDRGSDRAAVAAAGEPRGGAPSRATGRQRHQAAAAEAREPPATAQARLAAPGRPPTGRALDARRTGRVRWVASAKPRGGAAGCCGAAWTTAAVRGSWCGEPITCSSSGAPRVRRSRSQPMRWPPMAPH